ncbi:ankyrin repeat-containing domain protein [Xylogone sp. PMI_703]|nr:ankyrin repeat-containing domain protein [Xylogone sp. PMI_703]
MGARIQVADRLGNTALHTAVYHNCVAAVKDLISAGTPVDATNVHDWTPLSLAVRYGRTQIVRALIHAGADVNLHCFHGWTPLHIARMHGRVELLQILIEAGADSDGRDNDGINANKANLGNCGWGVVSRKIEAYR